MRNNRFWYGHLTEENGGSIVIWDREAPALPDDQVYLYHAKRHKILKYKKDIVRNKISPLSKEEYSVIDAVIKKYFSARSEESIELWKEKCFQSAEDESEMPRELQQGKTCYQCDGAGFEYGSFGAITCPVCLGWGKIVY